MSDANGHSEKFGSVEEFLAFSDCLQMCIETPELITQFNRLFERKLGVKLPRTPIEAAVDKATGFDKVLELEQQQEFAAFAEFVRRYIWQTLAPEARQDMIDAVKVKLALIAKENEQ